LRYIEKVHRLFPDDVDRQSSFESYIEKVKRHLRIDGARPHKTRLDDAPSSPGGIGWLYEMISIRDFHDNRMTLEHCTPSNILKSLQHARSVSAEWFVQCLVRYVMLHFRKIFTLK
jgi:hypothetical protein